MIRRLMASPSPDPSPGGFVVKKGSKSLFSTPLAIPGPLSAIWILAVVGV